MTAPFENLFDKVKKNTGKASQQFGLAAKIGKLRLEVTTQKAERERHLKSIGEKTYAIFMRENMLNGKIVLEEVISELNLIDRIDAHIKILDEQIANLQSEFRADKDIVDASEIKETDDDACDEDSEDL